MPSKALEVPNFEKCISQWVHPGRSMLDATLNGFWLRGSVVLMTTILIWFTINVLGTSTRFLNVVPQISMTRPLLGYQDDKDHFVIYGSEELDTMPVKNNVTSLVIRNPRASDQDAELLSAKFPNLKSLVLMSCEISGDGLRAIARCQHLESLELLWEHNVFFKDFAALKDLKHLRRLEVRLIDGLIDDVDQAKIVFQSLTGVNHLVLVDCRFKPAALVELRELASLQTLGVASNKS